MPTAICDGIETRYELNGAGPPLLMLSPGGFNATVENWTGFGIYARLNLLERLAARFTCVAFDKRESGASGGRVEATTWTDYARQGLALLDHLGVERTHVIGGCIGCSIALAVAVAEPGRVERLVLYSPAGGPRYRMTQHARFAEHRAFASEHGLDAVVALAGESESTFAQDPRVGPWATVLRRDDDFARAYVERDPGEYGEVVSAMAARLFDRDTVPGPPADELAALAVAALVVPGRDPSHAASAAWYLHECLSQSELWDVPPEEQTSETAPARVLAFLE